jgi:putative transcriptional regulator
MTGGAVKSNHKLSQPSLLLCPHSLPELSVSGIGPLPLALEAVGRWEFIKRPFGPQFFGLPLKVARAERALSQEELAALAGVTRQTISAIETRQYCPSALLAFLLAKQLGKRVDELFFLEGETS